MIVRADVRAVGVIGVAALTVAGSATGDLVGTRLDRVGADGDFTTFRVRLVFDNEADQLLAIGGDADVNGLVFQVDTYLIQDCLFYNSQPCDVMGPLDGGHDSWVNIGDEIGQTEFSPNFLGGDGEESVIKGCFFSQSDNGGYFDAEPFGTRVRPDENGFILIAQFTLPDDTCFFRYEGTAFFVPGGADPTQGFAAVPFRVISGGENCDDPWCRGCDGDFDRDGFVGMSDLLALLARWGPCAECREDIDLDGEIGFGDLVILLGAWGECS